MIMSSSIDRLEEQPLLPYPKREAYISYKPWDQYFMNSPANRVQPPKLRNVNIPRNVLGEEVDLGMTERVNKGDLTDKEFTSDCNQCPFYVTSLEAESLAGLIQQLRVRDPLDYQGLCIYGQHGKILLCLLIANKR